ncbi:Zinc finger hit domain-containing protein 2 [Plakobranchus ocellatus]|uniref:Zinc finger hit domain-containing protein 2 n=1 Tax=Plakobranchus ocellatus TaxID=259542 RepID=A0AAV4C1R2_9GAST|nr:Zinc finger hit domain-containing protein 2 [Plakobranchus ocellatus]
MAAVSEKPKMKVDDIKILQDNDEENVLSCKMCFKAVAKYTCPRCNMSYCSLPCYQSEKHSGCSEAFYKDCVVDELSQMTPGSEDKQKVLEMLAKDLKDRTEEDPGESSEDDLADRVEDLDLDDDIGVVWGRLKPKEKEEFARMLQDGRLAHIIELWTPWWNCEENKKLVLENGETKKKQSLQQMPDILTDIPDINHLLKNNRPSAECKFNLINVLFAYAFVSRLHNGCHLECPMDSAQDVLESCFVLRDQNRCGSAGEAIQKALDDVCTKGNRTDGSSHSFNLKILEDVQQLVCGPGKEKSLTFISVALSDLITLFQSTLRIIKKELKDRRQNGSDESDLIIMRSSAFKAQKKLEFLLSWSQRYGIGAHQLLPQLQFEIETRQAEAEQVDEIKAAIESNFENLKPVHSNDKNEETAQPATRNAKIIELD